MDGVAYTIRDSTGHRIETHLSSTYLSDLYHSKNGAELLKREIPGIVHHEFGHAFQWDAHGSAPGALIEGIADFVRVKSGYAPLGWKVPEPSPDTKWDEGSATWFLIWLDDQFPGLPKRLNQAMFRKFHEDVFYVLTGRSVGSLWKEYQAWLIEHRRHSAAQANTK